MGNRFYSSLPPLNPYYRSIWDTTQKHVLVKRYSSNYIMLKKQDYGNEMTKSVLFKENLSEKLDGLFKVNTFLGKADRTYWCNFVPHILLPSSSCIKFLIISWANAYPQERHQRRSNKPSAPKKNQLAMKISKTAVRFLPIILFIQADQRD